LQAIPQKINEARTVLSQMETLVQVMHEHEASTPQHEEWLGRLSAAWSRAQGGADAAALLIDGPLNCLMDADLTESQLRRQTLSSALLEAAIHEETEIANQKDGFSLGALEKAHEKTSGSTFTPKDQMGLPDPDKVQAALVDWLQLGAWRKREQSPLTEIGRMVERSSDTAEDAVATRLGLLVPFWSSLVLWRFNFVRARAAESAVS